ncbi:hypothetical protein HU200_067022 [Digitaria exilis]|uniref:Pectinesterase inhibitor domain-containing protein n=1 Tax=Digitaria exilis TaxID=1010633 RepID=A0A834ZX55_9POAL|nr:hypothetical protein HU200_067022 [Digitaria exilis]
MASSSTNRNNITSLLTLMFFIIINVREVAGEPPSVVPSACKRAYGVGIGSFTEDFCLSALTGHSAGAADDGDLALIAVDLATANATDTERKIDELLRGGGGGDVSEGLQSCRALYKAVVHQYQPQCRAAVKDRRFADGKLCLFWTAQATADCERWFQQRMLASPVAREDDSLAKLANLAIALSSIA